MQKGPCIARLSYRPLQPMHTFHSIGPLTARTRDRSKILNPCSEPGSLELGFAFRNVVEVEKVARPRRGLGGETCRNGAVKRNTLKLRILVTSILQSLTR